MDTWSGVREVPLGEIHVNPQQPRLERDEGKFRELVKSVAEWGVLEPITVQPWQGGLQIVIGEGRYLACLELGRPSVPALCRNDLRKAEVLELALVENICRNDLGLLEKVLGVQAWLVAKWGVGAGVVSQKVMRFAYGPDLLSEQEHLDLEKAARLLGGCNPRVLYEQRWALQNLPSSVKQALREKRITCKVALALRSFEDGVVLVDLLERVAVLGERKALTLIKQMRGGSTRLRGRARLLKSNLEAIVAGFEGLSEQQKIELELLSNQMRQVIEGNVRPMGDTVEVLYER